MSHTTYEVHSWVCSIPECKSTLTGYGADYAHDNGWENETILGQEFDLCPDCFKDLQSFLFGEERSGSSDKTV